MSVQFGRWNFEHAEPAAGYLKKVRDLMEPYGPDGTRSYSASGVDLIYSALHTTKESRTESQPYVTPTGTVVTWDGRLDNRSEWIAQMGDLTHPDSPDVVVVASAYERFGARSFARLLGDWALSIWEPRDRSLVLAKDPIGTRHLFYSAENDHIAWSSILDPLVLLPARSVALDEEYIAGWLSAFPATHLTPYVGIRSVPPSSYVRFAKGTLTVKRYWDFDPNQTIRYRADAEYEEHFRSVFRTSIERCLRSDRPVLAELSGGVDSSSIVSMADTVLTQQTAEAPRLDTVSYYSELEPHWNERPYFTKIEQQRGRVGCHIDLSVRGPFKLALGCGTFAATPGSPGAQATEASRQLEACMISGQNRVVLSGIGGDEVTGGVPTPIPELMDLLAGAHIKRFAHQLKEWALAKRKPWIQLLASTVKGFLPPRWVRVAKHLGPAPWLSPGFVRRNKAALTGYPTRVRWFGPTPSFQENCSTLEVLRRQLACSVLRSKPLFEKRYPFLDRELLEFLFAVPRDQLVRPGQRRSLIRRALEGIVPDEVLNRKRKAFASRGMIAKLSGTETALSALNHSMLGAALGVFEERLFRTNLKEAQDGRAVPVLKLLRTVDIELWLTRLQDYGIRVERLSAPAARSQGHGVRDWNTALPNSSAS